MEIFKCEYCKREFKTRNALCSHIGKCKNNPNASNKEPSEKQRESWNNFKGKCFLKKDDFICDFCGKKFEYKHSFTAHIRYFCDKNPNNKKERENQKEKLKNIQKEIWKNKELRKNQSEKTVFNNFWKYRTKNPIIYESKIAGKMKLDSSWELEVAKRLDELNVEWYRPKIRLPYLDSNGVEHGYFPDFYVKTFNCFIEVKSEFIANWQNSDNKCSYIKEHYKFIKWIETEEQCKTFVLQDLGCNFVPEKDEEDISYWIELSNKNKQKTPSKVEKLKEERWQLLQNSDIDFSKFGWVKKASELFGIAENKAGKYIKKHFPEFYKTCYKRN